jgi:hypothetical protein
MEIALLAVHVGKDGEITQNAYYSYVGKESAQHFRFALDLIRKDAASSSEETSASSNEIP